MKFELNRPIDNSDEAILDEIKRVAANGNKPLTKTVFQKSSKYSPSTIEKRFGGWLNALRKAELDETYLHTYNIHIPTEKIVEELKRVGRVLKTNSFSRQQFAENSLMRLSVFKGNFKKLMKEAGLAVPKKSRKYTEKDCLENLLNVWMVLGRQPNYGEMKHEPSIVGPKAYIVRWGSWTKALVAFIEKVNSDIAEDSVLLENRTAEKQIVTR